MLREQVLREWNEFKSKLLCRWEKRKYLPSLRAWIVQELFPMERFLTVSNEQIAEAIRGLTGKNGLEYLDMSSSESEEDE